MSPPLPAEARINDWRTAILSTVAEMLDLAAETMREHGIAAAVTQTDDAAWELRVEEFMRHLGVSRHEAQRIREKALEDGL